MAIQRQTSLKFVIFCLDIPAADHTIQASNVQINVQTGGVVANIKHHALTAAKVRTETNPGNYNDGNRLTLRLQESGSKQWVLRTTINGKARNIGLGGYPHVGLAEARELAHEKRMAIRQGIDPIHEKRAAKKQAMAQASIPTFREVALKEIERRRSSCKGDVSAEQWEGTFTNYVFPIIGNKRVDEITTHDIRKILKPIWLEKEETARRVRQRMGATFKLAISRDWTKINPSDTFITSSLPVQTNIKENLRATPYPEVPSAVVSIRNSDSDTVTKLALEFKILTAARTAELLSANWAEFDLEKGIRTAPATLMKMKRPHSIPLSDRVLEILDEARTLYGDKGIVFPSKRSVNKGDHKPLSDGAFGRVLETQGINAVPHGFRSSFKDWASEKQPGSDMPAEFSLAHVEGSRAKQAYLRTQLVETRRGLMNNWAVYVESGESPPFEWVPSDLAKLSVNS